MMRIMSGGTAEHDDDHSGDNGAAHDDAASAPTPWTIGVRGPTIVLRDGEPVRLRPKERSVVAALAAVHPRPAATHHIAHLVWGPDVPPSATKSLHNHVARIRRAAPGLIESDGGTYRLGDHVRLDLAIGGPARPLDDLAELGDVVVLREHLGLMAAEHDETLLESQALRGLTPELVRALHDAVADEPYRERRWRLLADAQARQGQRRDALLTLGSARQHLAEVGLDPGPELRDLETSILRGDPWSSTERRRNPPIHPHHDEPFVGRRHELEELRRVWADVVDRHRPAAVLIGGAAGIGKTRLVDEFVQSAARDGGDVRVVWGRHRENTGRAHGALAESLAQLALAEPTIVPPDDPLRSLLSSGAEPSAPSATVRTQLGRAVVELVDRLGRRPTIWLFDDMHWASPDAMSLLDEAFDGATGSLLVIATSRPRPDAIGGWFGQITRSMPTTILTPELFDAAEIDELLRISGARTDAATAAVVHRQTGGLPLYATEVTRASRASGTIDASHVPGAVRDWMHHRMSQLPHDAVAVLRAAALAGDDVDVDLVATVTGLERRAVASQCDEFVVAGLLTVDDRQRLGFAHSLTRDIVAESVGPMARRDAHRVIAETLADRPRPAHETIAYHFDRAGDARVVEHALAAGDEALAVGAWATALDRFELAAANADDQRAVALALIGSGRALMGASRLGEAAARFVDAIAIAIAIDDATVHARAALHLVGRAGRGALVGDEARQVRVLREALGHVERTLERSPAPLLDRSLMALTCELERELAIGMLLTDDHAERARLLRSSLSRAERIDPPDPLALAQARLGLRYSQLGAAELADRLANIDVVRSVAPGHLDAETSISLECFSAEDLLRAERFDEAWSCLDRAELRLASYPDPYWSWAVATWRVVQRIVDGDLEAAEAVAFDAFSLRSDVAETQACLGVNLIDIRLLQGRSDEMIPLLQTAIDEHPEIPAYRAVLALCAAESGDDDLAERCVRALVGEGSIRLPFDTNRFLAVNALGHAAATAGLVDAAAVLLDEIVPFDGQWVLLNCYGGGGAVWGPVAWTVSRLLRCVGDHERADEAAQRAVAESTATPLFIDRITASTA